MLSSQAMAAVGAMMTAFGGAGGTLTDNDIGCVAGKIWQAGRNGSFAFKLQLAKDQLAHLNFDPKKCNISASQSANGGTNPTVEFRHRRDTEAWDDAILATLTVINSVQLEENAHLYNTSPQWSGTNRVNLLAHSNILLFWQNTPIQGIDVEPEQLMLKKASAAGSG